MGASRLLKFTGCRCLELKLSSRIEVAACLRIHLTLAPYPALGYLAIAHANFSLSSCPSNYAQAHVCVLMLLLLQGHTKQQRMLSSLKKAHEARKQLLAMVAEREVFFLPGLLSTRRLAQRHKPFVLDNTHIRSMRAFFDLDGLDQEVTFVTMQAQIADNSKTLAKVTAMVEAIETQHVCFLVSMTGC
jgi:hypothetical protein